MGYDYIKAKRLHTYMQVKPSQTLTEKHVTALGFTMRNKEKKNCEIVLKSMKYDLKQTLMLSYYSMPMAANFIPEGCMALFLNNQSNATNGQFPLDKLFQMVQTFTHLLKNEQLLYGYTRSLTPEGVLERAEFFAKINSLVLTEDKQHIANIDD